MKVSWTSRLYDCASDYTQLFEIWEKAFGFDWPLCADALQRIVGPEALVPVAPHLEVLKETLVVEEGSKPIAFLSAACLRNSELSTAEGCITVLLVSPEYQRKGIGRTLMTDILKRFKERGIKKIRIGARFGAYFFPGIPTNLPTAAKFFQSFGWNGTDTVSDLTGDLRIYSTPGDVDWHSSSQTITLRTADESDISDTIGFEQQHFPNWQRFFQLVADQQGYEDILIARDELGTVAGSLLIRDQRASWRKNGILWDKLLGENVGGIGCVGVSESHRGRGIGLAMVAKAAATLKERGCDTGFIGWTTLTDWYARLGFQPWREYLMGTIET